MLAVLAVRPEIDPDVARGFINGANLFISDTRSGVIMRYAAWYLPFGPATSSTPR